MHQPYYPGFDVLAEQHAWDQYTRSIISQRLTPPTPTVLAEPEVATLRAVERCLLHEERDEILDFVVAHVDARVQSTVGEGQRKPGVPPEGQLVRQGLLAIDALARVRHGQGFADCGAEQQTQILAALQKGEVPEMGGIPQKDLFQKLLSIGVDACASHPTVWSEMGYAGPAYPRGYYRMDRGVRDLWEPRFVVPHRAEADTDGPDAGGE